MLTEYSFTADKFVFKVVKSLLYSRDDIWVRKEETGYSRIGLTDFAQRSSGDIVFAETQSEGTNVKNGSPLGSYETIKVVQDIISPITGTIIENNPLLDSKPEIINSDPYGEGWITLIKPELKLEGLLSAEEYFELMKVKVNDELKKIKGL